MHIMQEALMQGSQKLLAITLAAKCSVVNALRPEIQTVYRHVMKKQMSKQY